MEFIKGTKLLALDVFKNNGKFEISLHDIETLATDGFKIAFKTDVSDKPIITNTSEVNKHLDKKPGYVEECMCGKWAHNTTLYFTTEESRQQFLGSLV